VIDVRRRQGNLARIVEIVEVPWCLTGVAQNAADRL
jgi:hypothetical protein